MSSRTRRARGAWLVLPLLLAALLAPSICWCARGGGGHCGGGESESVASCHGGSSGKAAAPRSGAPEPCPPGHDCGCLASGHPVAKISEGLALEGLALAPMAWFVLPALAPLDVPAAVLVETAAVPRPPGPPVFLLVRSIRC